MKSKTKEIFMKAVVEGSLSEVEVVCKRHDLVLDDDYFDYELVQAALKRKNFGIIHFLINKTGCRLENPKKVNSEESPLYLALKFGKEAIIRSMLRKGVSMYNKNHNAETPLHAAFKEKYFDSIRMLFKFQVYAKPKCVAENEDDVLHFHIACVTNHIAAAEQYLKCGINPNKPLSLDSAEYSGFNPVQYAAEKNFYTLFKMLVSHGADLSIKNDNGRTPLHAIYYTSPPEDRISRIKETFKNGNDTKFVNLMDTNGVSHFQLCCILNEPDFIQVFIDNGANVKSSVSSNCTIYPGFTPLHFAVENNSEKVVELLLKKGADCNKKDKEGKTPLHLACKLLGYWKERIIKMLLDHNASPIIADKEGYTPIHTEFYHVNSEDKNILDMLTSKIQRKVNFKNNEGVTFFHIASATNNINQMKGFLNSGVKVNSPVSSGIYSGYTALHFAVLHNQKDAVELLLKKNAEVNIETKELKITPLHLACEFNYMKFREENSKYQSEEKFKAFPVNLESVTNHKNQLEIIRLLLSNGANVEATDLTGMTPLFHTVMIDSNYSKLEWSYLSYPSAEKEAFMKEISSRLKEIIEIFISEKAKMVACSNTQESILHIIAKYNTLRITEKLINLILAEGVSIDEVDDAGLTPLHVAVKFRNKKLIRILLKFKANVNAKCKNFKTPLHVVIEKGMRESHERDILVTLLENGSDVNLKHEKNLKYNVFGYKNEFIIEKLLFYGADINLKDSIVNSCFLTLIQRTPLFKEFDNSIKIFEIIFTHERKLLALDLYVSRAIQNFCNKIYKCYVKYDPYSYVSEVLNISKTNNLKHILKDCIKELDKMKMIKIDYYTSLYSILLKDSHELSKHVKNNRLIEILQAADVDTKFSLYSYLLKLQFNRGSIRRDLLESAKASLTNIINLELPDLCFDLVMKHLTDEEIANVNAAAPLKKDLKRKCDDANQAASLLKLPKPAKKFKRK